MAKDIFLTFSFVHFSFQLLPVVGPSEVVSNEGKLDTDNHNPDDDAEIIVNEPPYYEHENATFGQQVVTGSYLWPNATMYYELSDTLSYALQKRIRVAMDGIQDTTCVRFLKWKGNVNQNRVLFHSDSTSACYSEILGYGRKPGQLVQIGSDCLSTGVKIGGLQHEILHVLGIAHTHQRPDRDKYIDIFWNNLKHDPGTLSQMDLWPHHYLRTYQAVPYDYSSVMHYPNHAHAKDSSKPTMSKKGDNSVCLGQANGVTECDLELIRHAYGCFVLNSCEPELNFKRREFPNFWTKTCKYLW